MRDYRYDNVKSIWKAGDLDSFGKIFTIVPKSVVCVDLIINYGRFMTKLRKPELFTFHDIQRLSELIGVDFEALVQLLLLEIQGSTLNKKGIATRKNNFVGSI